MGLQETKEPGALGEVGKQRPIVTRQPAIEGPVAHALEGMQQPQSDDLTGPEVGLRVFGDGVQLLIDLVEQRRDQLMESKSGALLPLSSGFPLSAPRTGQVAFTTSGAPTPSAFRIFAHTYSLLVMRAYYPPSRFHVPGMSRPLPHVPGFPGLPGRALLRRVLRVRCPHNSIGDLSTYPEGSSCG